MEGIDSAHADGHDGILHVLFDADEFFFSARVLLFELGAELLFVLLKSVVNCQGTLEFDALFVFEVECDLLDLTLFIVDLGQHKFVLLLENLEVNLHRPTRTLPVSNKFLSLLIYLILALLLLPLLFLPNAYARHYVRLLQELLHVVRSAHQPELLVVAHLLVVSTKFCHLHDVELLTVRVESWNFEVASFEAFPVEKFALKYNFATFRVELEVFHLL